MAKSQKELDDDVKYRNRFRDGENDEPMKRKVKRTMDKPTGKYSEAEKEKYGSPVLDHAAKIIRGGTSEQGSGALAKRRRKVIDSNIDEAGG